jgi:hypothetical protein
VIGSGSGVRLSKGEAIAQRDLTLDGKLISNSSPHWGRLMRPFFLSCRLEASVNGSSQPGKRRFALVQQLRAQ